MASPKIVGQSTHYLRLVDSLPRTRPAGLIAGAASCRLHAVAAEKVEAMNSSAEAPTSPAIDTNGEAYDVVVLGAGPVGQTVAAEPGLLDSRSRWSNANWSAVNAPIGGAFPARLFCARSWRSQTHAA